MKKNIVKNSIICVFMAIMIFALLFSINMIVKTSNGNGALVSGIEPYIQEAFIPESSVKLEEMDTTLKQDYSFYKGYTYYGVTTAYVDEEMQSHYIYMAGEAMNLSLFFTLSEGKYFDYTDGDSLPVIVGGEGYNSVKIGEHMALTFQPYDGGRLLGVDAVVVGKIDKRNYRYPEAVSSKIMAEMVSEGFIVCPDAYLNQVVNFSDKYILLNYDRYNSNCTQATIDEMRAIASNYGAFTTLQEPYNSSMYDMFQKINVYWYIIIVIAALMIIILTYLLLFKCNAEGMLDIIMPNIIMVMVSAILLLIYNAIGGILMAYRMPMWYFMIMIVVGLISSLLMLWHYKKSEQTSRSITEAQKNEKI